MHCEYCGKEIGEARFCRYCGKEIVPPVKVEPWKHSVPFSILGIALSTASLLYFQMQGLYGALWYCVYTLFACMWLCRWMPRRSTREIARLKGPADNEHCIQPKNGVVSFANCYFAWFFGLLLNKRYAACSIGGLPKKLVLLISMGCLVTLCVGFSIGFLYVSPLDQFALRSISAVQFGKNNVRARYYCVNDSDMTVYIYEPTWGSPYSPPEPYRKARVEEIAERDTPMDVYTGDDLKALNEKSNGIFGDAEAVVFAFTREGDDAYTNSLYEVRFIFEGATSPDECRDCVKDFLLKFDTF